ncbi:hypothetical protein NAPIS_ORF00208 [Vairimorpha apis BRL 01]|uniref:Uncharacterized protein n=1 Tax=Vairimorpha apis BRL 01 TaxID=1037528 RepID=T0MMI1_9MICR|nr:hypothetical protein NAPIS_ORF00208 [Vairimorpha apis BRL 01]
MQSRESENTTSYENLSIDEKTSLRQHYLNEIANIDDITLFPCLCYKNMDVEKNSVCNDSVIEILDILTYKSTIHKLFYGTYRDEEIKEVYELVQKNEKIQYDSKNPRLIAQVFIWIVKWNDIPFFPHEFNKILFEAYLENDRKIQLEIVKRIPFVLNERNRIFFIKLKRLIEEIDAHKKIQKRRKMIYYIFLDQLFLKEHSKENMFLDITEWLFLLMF